jgi:hypothetical protein
VQKISFHEIKKVNFIIDGFWLADQRFVLVLDTKSDSTYTLISTNKEVKAKKLIALIYKIVKQSR